MMLVPQIRGEIEKLRTQGIERKHIASLAKDWVNGENLTNIARKYFMKEDRDATEALTKACQGIYRALANAGTWGLSALSRMGSSGLDFDTMPEDQKRVINNLPAMLYHGVNTEAAVLMRMNAVPRSIAVGLGEKYSATVKDGTDLHSVRSARTYLRGLSPTDWQHSAPPHAKMSGEDYRDIWSLLSGERS
jgi:hypothetical protein